MFKRPEITLADLIKSFLRVLLKIRYAPRLKVEKSHHELLRLGSQYGGWTFVNSDALKNGTVICAGLGEDASFDIEFLTLYSSKVIVIDPTPRAVAHYHNILESIGKPKTQNYSDNGKQEIFSYNLGSVNRSNLVLVPKALWNEKSQIKFYLPPNSDHVSHSIINYQNNYSADSQSIEVESICIDDVFSEFGIQKLPLIKLDIEGAEIEVINDLLQKRIFPDQILVEYDELSNPSKRSRDRIRECHENLLDNRYVLINKDRPSNHLYILKE